MNKEEPYRDQAERLRRRIEKINENVDVNDKLPPREQVHRQKKKKLKWKIKYPLMRSLILIFILLPIIIICTFSYLNGKKTNGSVKTTVDTNGSESITIEKTKKNNDQSSKPPEKQSESQQENKGTETEASTDQSSNTTPQAVQNETGDPNKQTNETNDGSQAANGVEPPAPTTVPASTSNISQPAPTKSQTKIIYHKVQPKETLFSIAMKYYNSQSGIDLIMKANHMQSEHIVTGQVLKIPLN
jgi:cytoskeletal protein RodZ